MTARLPAGRPQISSFPWHSPIHDILTNIVRTPIFTLYAYALRAPNAFVLIWVPGWPGRIPPESRRRMSASDPKRTWRREIVTFQPRITGDQHTGSFWEARKIATMRLKIGVSGAG